MEQSELVRLAVMRDVPTVPRKEEFAIDMEQSALLGRNVRGGTRQTWGGG